MCLILEVSRWYLKLMLPNINVVFLHQTSPVQWIFTQHCGYWWPGAVAPGQQQSQFWVHTHEFPVVYGLNAILNLMIYIPCELTIITKKPVKINHSGCHFNIKMPSYQHRNCYYRNKMASQPSYIHNPNTSRWFLYWNAAQTFKCPHCQATSYQMIDICIIKV